VARKGQYAVTGGSVGDRWRRRPGRHAAQDSQGKNRKKTIFGSMNTGFGLTGEGMSFRTTPSTP